MNAPTDVTETLRAKSRNWSEVALETSLAGAAFLSVLTTAGILAVLAGEAVSFLRDVSLLDFLTGTRWNPMIEPRSFGVLPLVGGTFLIVLGAATVAVPAGLAGAIYLAECAGPRTRGALKPVLEILAGIPTVVYGYFALTCVTPLLRTFLPSLQVFNALSASLVVGLMILPTVVSLCDDALRAVPRRLRDAGHALGATRAEVTLRVVVPSALSGLVAAFVLAISRAVGETMAVTLAAGATPRLTLDVTQPVQTMTAFIVQVSQGDAAAGTIEYRSLYAVGALLFVITLAFNLVAHRFLERFREVYD